MRGSRIILLWAMLLCASLLSGCLYVPSHGGAYGSVDYSVTSAGPCLLPGPGYRTHTRSVVPAPGVYRRHR
jgi:hypothetical protein